MNPKKWAAAEDEIIKKYYALIGPTGIYAEYGKILNNRSIIGIENRARKKLGMKFVRSKIKMKKWEPWEIEVLEQYYFTRGPKWIIDHMLKNRRYEQVKKKGQYLGLNRRGLKSHKKTVFSSLEIINALTKPWVGKWVYESFEWRPS